MAMKFLANDGTEFDNFDDCMSHETFLSAPVKLSFNNGMIGKYVIVRCKDAGVHAGYLVSHHDRQCVLRKSRRLWYWKPADRVL